MPSKLECRGKAPGGSGECTTSDLMPRRGVPGASDGGVLSGGEGGLWLEESAAFLAPALRDIAAPIAIPTPTRAIELTYSRFNSISKESSLFMGPVLH
jgi:hypothetical protein